MIKLFSLVAFMALMTMTHVSLNASETFEHECPSGAGNLFQDMEYWIENI